MNKNIYFKVNMKLQRTLTIVINCLFLLSFNANSAEMPADVKACNEAVNKNDANTALKYAETILEKDNTDYEGLLCKGRALNLQGNYTDALSSMELAAQSAKDPFSKVISYILIGNLHESNNKTEAAIASYQKSLEISVKSDNRVYTRINHNLIGDAYFKAKDLNAALDSYTTSTHLAKNDNERAESFERLAKTYNALGNHDKAIEYQLKTVVMQKQAGSLTAYAESSLLLGQYFIAAKEYGHAERHYKKLAEFAKANGGAYYEAEANFGLAEAMFANGDKAGAKTLFVNAANQAKKIGAEALAGEIDAAQKKLNI
jgi:tetratricopeptide (TPR) repeat protein